MPDDLQKLLTQAAYRPDDVERFLTPNIPTWVKFDTELGYVPSDCVMRDGVDNSLSYYNYDANGARRMVNHRERPCRINTYGDSFTQCQQVNDGETWQEYLAAHIGEPVRNFGVGGYGVYQAWRRARRTEQTEVGAEYVVLNIYDDDHVRNLDACRWLRTNTPPAPPLKDLMIHGLPWPHVRLDVKSGKWVEQPALCKTPNELRRLADPQKFYETFKDDFIARLFTVQMNGSLDHYDDLEAVAEFLNVKVDLRGANRRTDALRLRQIYGLRSTEFVLDQMSGWLAAAGKKFLVILSYREAWTLDAIAGKPRSDQSLIDYLKRKNVLYVDLLEKHVKDFQQFKLTPQQYIDRYFINAKGAAVVGHYNPTANHFVAFAIKDEIVNWLNPKPLCYLGS